MKISQKSEYALRAIFDLSLRAGDDLVKASYIASRQQIPLKFLELILGTLKQGGLVETRRGPEGGCRLARPADQITVGNVLALTEDPGNGRRGVQDAFTHLWNQVDESASAIIDGTTFADLAWRWERSKAEQVASRQI